MIKAIIYSVRSRMGSCYPHEANNQNENSLGEYIPEDAKMKFQSKHSESEESQKELSFAKLLTSSAGPLETIR